MTDNRDITPELALRVLAHLEHSKYIGPDGGLSALFVVKDAVENWANDIDSDDLVTQLAKALWMARWPDASNAEWNVSDASNRARWHGIASHALEFLTSTGRLVPDDDDVVDAEVYGLRRNGDWLLSSSELDDLRIAWEAVKGYRVDGYARPHVNRLVEVVGKLFAATAPVECEFRCEEGIVRAEVGVRCPACNAAIRASEEVSGNFVAGGNSSPTPPEPAEEVEEWSDIEDVPVGLIVKGQAMIWKWDGTHPYRRNGGGWTRESCDYANRWWPFTPAPAEPAEEETKAEEHRSVIHSSRTIKTVGEALSYAETALLNAYPESAQRAHYAEVIAELLRDVARQRPVASNGKHGESHTPTCGCEDVTFSSPVVPAPTETGPWPSIEKVPTGLVVIGTNGERFMGCPCESETHGYANQFAPFVAMKER